MWEDPPQLWRELPAAPTMHSIVNFLINHPAWVWEDPANLAQSLSVLIIGYHHDHSFLVWFDDFVAWYRPQTTISLTTTKPNQVYYLKDKVDGLDGFALWFMRISTERITIFISVSVNAEALTNRKPAPPMWRAHSGKTKIHRWVKVKQCCNCGLVSLPKPKSTLQMSTQ